MEDKLIRIKNKMGELMEFKKSNDFQQIKAPMGNITTNIVKQDRLAYISTQLLNPLYDISIEVSFRGVKFLISASTEVN